MSSNDVEGLAIGSLVAGILGLLFVMYAPGTAVGETLRFLGMIAGAGAIGAGFRALRGEASNKKLAVTGTITGTIALGFWILSAAWNAAVFVWHLL